MENIEVAKLKELSSLLRSIQEVIDAVVEDLSKDEFVFNEQVFNEQVAELWAKRAIGYHFQYLDEHQIDELLRDVANQFFPNRCKEGNPRVDELLSSEDVLLLRRKVVDTMNLVLRTLDVADTYEVFNE